MSRSLYQFLYDGRPPALPKPPRPAKELMPNLLTVVLGMLCLIAGLEWIDERGVNTAIEAANKMLKNPLLTDADRQAAIKTIADARTADAANDDVVKYGVGAIGGVLLALAKRNGNGHGDKELDAVDREITRLEESK